MRGIQQLETLCNHIEKGYADGHSGMDKEVLPHLIELGDQTETIRDLIEAVKALESCRSWLREYNVQMGPDTGLHMLEADVTAALEKFK